ncbi:MAG: hypothetical protein ACLP3R_11155 [Candidatus Korobacteraceae bacterium]
MGTAGAKVTVASKLPMSIEMQCCTKRVQKFRNGSLQWEEELSTKDGPIVIIAGTGYPVAPPETYSKDRPETVAGAALTHGVDKAFFDRWMEENKSSPMVVNKLIFAHERPDTVKGLARDYKAFKSGLDPLVPDNDPRMPKKLVVAERGRANAEVG